MFGSRRGRRYSLYRDHHRKGKSPLVVRLLFWLFVAYLCTTTFVVQSLRIDSTSMEPTFLPADRVFASPLGFGARIPIIGVSTPAFRDPDRGDLVVVESDLADRPGFLARTFDPLVRFVTGNTRGLESSGNPAWANRYVVRRVIGLPGDRVEVVNSVARITPAGSTQPTSETALAPRRYSLEIPDLPGPIDQTAPFFGRMEPVQLGPDQYFLMGDNRGSVLDSRHTGPVSRARIVQRILFRYWPLRRFGVPSA